MSIEDRGNWLGLRWGSFPLWDRGGQQDRRTDGAQSAQTRKSSINKGIAADLVVVLVALSVVYAISSNSATDRGIISARFQAIRQRRTTAHHRQKGAFPFLSIKQSFNRSRSAVIALLFYILYNYTIIYWCGYTILYIIHYAI